MRSVGDRDRDRDDGGGGPVVVSAGRGGASVRPVAVRFLSSGAATRVVQDTTK